MSASLRVLLTDPIAPEGEEILARSAEVVRAPDAGAATLRRLARDSDGVIVRSKLPDDIVPVADATARGVMVANLPGSNAQSVAEYCAMAMLMLARNVLAITQSLRTVGWDPARALGAGTHEISGMTLGVVGVGEIGSRVAKIARQGFGMRVLGHQRRLERLPADAEPAELDALVCRSDFIVLSCPLTAETRYLFDSARIAKMRPSAWLINVGRGAVVQESALVEALAGKRIAGAMLDVYENFRLAPGHRLIHLDNAILTPHLAGMTVECNARMAMAAAEEMLRMLAGNAPRNLVNPQCVNLERRL